jgi:hypothetical protein
MHQMRQQRKAFPRCNRLTEIPLSFFVPLSWCPRKMRLLRHFVPSRKFPLRPARRRIAVSDAVCYSGARRICMIHKIHGGGDLTAEHLSLGYASTHICGTLNDRFPGPYCRNVARLSEWLTSREIAERLGTTAGRMSSRLSKLAAYGIIGKARGTLVTNGTKGAVYRLPSHSPSDSVSP